MSRHQISLALILAFTVACRDTDRVTGPERPSATILDGATGGIRGFYFLPPIAPQPVVNGTFDRSVSPTVQICETVACSALRAVYTMNSGPGSETVRVDAQKELYIVNWQLDKTGAVAGKTYRVRVLLGQAVLGFADVLFRAKGSDATPNDPSIVVVNGTTLAIKFRIETVRGPRQAATCVSCLEVVPGALLLSGKGAQQQLAAFLVDAQGNRTPVAATFESSNAGVVAVSAGGLATAAADLGSSKIVAHAGSNVSAPVLALVAQPVAGALLVSDEQVDGVPTPVDPAAKYKPGFRYRVRLRGVTPQVGQVILSSGYAPIEGKVISVTPGSGFVDVVLELLSIKGMFARISVNENIPLGAPPLAQALSGQASRVRMSPTPLERMSRGGARVSATNVRIVTPPASSAGAAETKIKFDLGPLECEAELKAGVSFPLTFDVATFSINPSLALDEVIDAATNDVTRYVVSGTLSPQVDIDPRLNAAVEGSVECSGEAKPISPIPLPGGSLGALLGAFIEIGAGAGLEAKTSTGGVGFDAFLQATVTLSAGFACTPGCKIVGDLQSSAGGSFKPIFPQNFSVGAEFGASFFAYASLKVGSPLLATIELVKLKAGLEQKLDLNDMISQALNDEYASTFELGPLLEVEAGEDVQDAAELLGITLELPSFSPDLTPVAQSPRGTFTIEPSDVSPGDDTEPGELATFRVNLPSTTYFGFDAVESVEIRWLKKDDNDIPFLDFGRPGCIQPIPFDPFKPNVYECKAAFLVSQEGEQTFYAFIHSKLFGVPVPIPLEVAPSGKATVTVSRYGHYHRLVNFFAGPMQEVDILTANPLSGSGGSYAGTGVITYHATNVVTRQSDGCLLDTVLDGGGTNFTVTRGTGSRPWVLTMVVSGTSTVTPRCGGSTLTGPFNNLTLPVGTGVDIIDNGELKGINFTQTFTTSTTTVTATGKLKVQ